MTRKRIALISTGGTIEKTYDELEGVLENRITNLDVLLAQLTLNGVSVVRVSLMNKDSLTMSGPDHTLIAETARNLARTFDGVVVVHGTDRLAITGEQAYAQPGPLDVPIVFTGAMRPFELRTTDASQNVTEALLAVQLLPAGVYLVMHNRVLAFPGVTKDRNHGTFTQATVTPPEGA